MSLGVISVRSLEDIEDLLGQMAYNRPKAVLIRQAGRLSTAEIGSSSWFVLQLKQGGVLLAGFYGSYG